MSAIETDAALGLPATGSPPGVGWLVAEAIRSIDGARDTAQLYAYVGSLCRRLGFDYFSYFLADPLQLGQPSVGDPMGSTSYPEPWRTRYMRLGYAQHDPLLNAGHAIRHPFVWGGRDYVRHLRGTARQMFDEAGSFGICGGCSFPVYGPGGDRGLFSASSRETGDTLAEIVMENTPMLHVVAHRMHAAMVERLLPPQASDAVDLTDQERLCLSWTLQGKTAWEIARIIGRSRATVNFHLQKSMRKLGTSSKSHAAMKAMQAGLI